MRARTLWLAAGGIVAAFVAVLVIPQTRDALVGALFSDESIDRCDSQDPKVAIPGCTELLVSGRYENLRGGILVRRASFYSDVGQHEMAIKDLEEALKLFPENVEAHFDLAGAYSQAGNNDRAIAEYDEVIKRDPKNTFAYMFRSGLKEKKGDAAGAAADRAIVEQLGPLLPVPTPE
jgi:tetratricopeptide (TPR) repeat protein